MLGEAAHAKHGFQVGDTVSGEGERVTDPRLETAEIYKVSKLSVLARAASEPSAPPPWHGIAPVLPVYRERGHRRLAARTYDKCCKSCIWSALMAVEMVIGATCRRPC